jgi:oligoribonuclease
MAQDDWWPSRPDHRRLMLKSVGDSSKTLAQVDGELSEFADQYCTSPLYMAGNSPYKDRAFVERDLPDLHSRLHHRMLDVSSFKIVGKNILNTDYPKREQHRALDDLFESIDEFNFLLRALGTKSVVEFLERRRSF